MAINASGNRLYFCKLGLCRALQSVSNYRDLQDALEVPTHQAFPSQEKNLLLDSAQLAYL